MIANWNADEIAWWLFIAATILSVVWFMSDTMRVLVKTGLRRIATAAITVPAVAMLSIAIGLAILRTVGFEPHLSMFVAIPLAAVPGVILIAIWFRWRALLILPLGVPLAICVAAGALWLIAFVYLAFQPPGSFP